MSALTEISRKNYTMLLL